MFGVVVYSFLLTAVMGNQGFIIGGEDVDPIGKWPWQGSLNLGSSHNCGAVLIENPQDPENNIWAFTASHCVEGSPSSYTVYFGLHNRNDDTQGEPEAYDIISITQHPDWFNSGSSGFPNDIALIQLDRPANLENEFIDTIKFSNSSSDYYTDAECWITGWGATTGGGSLPEILQEVEIPTLDDTTCRQYWGQINHGHICVMDEEQRDRGACNGDSGGPLVCSRDSGESWELVGLTSWGRSGCSTTSPSVYNRVGWYSKWATCVIELEGSDEQGLCDKECPCDSSVCDTHNCKISPN